MIPTATSRRNRLLELAWNRCWLLVPILVLDLALVNKLPPPLAPRTVGPHIPGWISLSETVLRVVVMGAPLLMPLSLRRSARSLAVYGFGLAAYIASWVAVIWAPDSAWSTSAIGFTALAWTSILVFVGIGLDSTLRYVPRYRPWMYLSAAVAFTAVHTTAMWIIWASYYA